MYYLGLYNACMSSDTHMAIWRLERGHCPHTSESHWFLRLACEWSLWRKVFPSGVHPMTRYHRSNRSLRLKRQELVYKLSFKYIKAWESTLVLPAKVVLPASNLICYFKIPFFLSTSPAACRSEEKWELHSMYFCPALHILTLRICSPITVCMTKVMYAWHWVLLVPWVAEAWYTWGQGKVWVRPDAVSTQSKAYETPHLHGGGQFNIFAKPSLSENFSGWLQTLLAVALGTV